MNIAIVEDLLEDRLWLSRKIKKYMEQHHLNYSLHEFIRAEEFVESLSSTTYSIVFMDIFFEGMSGMDAAEQLRQIDRNCKLIFLTCTPDYALQGYSVNASHYLVKPVETDKFDEAMNNCHICPQYAVPYLDLSGNGLPEKLNTGGILYISLLGRTVYIHMLHQTLSINSSFSRVTEPLLSDKRFLICIQGIMVNMDYISGHEDSVFIMKNGDRIPINLRNRKRILQQYRNYMFDTMGGHS